MSFQPTLTASRGRQLSALDRDPAPLLQSLSGLKSTRLGIYFEALWRFFIETDPQLELKAANVPIAAAGKTLGEFDLIIFDRDRGNHLHIELASKYYLKANTPFQMTGGPLSGWLGPNTRDRLDLKVDRLLRHQVRLSERPEAAGILRELEIRKLEKAVVLKGCLFYPQAEASEVFTPAAELNPEHPHGRWLHHTDIHAVIDCDDYWHLLERPRWLSPALFSTKNHPALLDRTALRSHLQHYFSQPAARPQMLCAMTELNNYWVERARYMITPDTWPDQPVGTRL